MKFEENALAAGFRIQELVGSGGSGTVYRAIEEPSQRQVALKVLRPGANPARLQREADLLARVQHAGVARLIGLHRIGDDDVLVVEWIDGRSLASVIRAEGKLEPGRATSIISQVAVALAAVHGSGVVHRDVSPANIVITDDDRAVLIDFGISVHDDAVTVTAEGALAGTPRYLAPEVIEGADPTPASDQYSAAILFYEMLTGRWPFPGGDSVANALHAQLNALPVPLTEVDPGQSFAVDAALAQALEKRPEDRHDSMVDFGSAVRLSAVGVRPAEPRGRSGGVGAVVALVALVTAAGVAGWAMTRDTPSPDTGAVVEVAAEPEATPTPSASALPEATVVPEADSPAAGQAPEPEAPEPTATPEPDPTPALPPPVEAVSVAGASSDGIQQLGEAAIHTEIAPLAVGRAASLYPDCNLLAQNGFDTPELETNFYAHPDSPGRDRIVPGTGLDGTPGIEIGDPDGFGKYAEWARVEAGQSYVFSAYVRVEGDIFNATMTIDWLDEEWTAVNAAPAQVTITDREVQEGQISLRSAPAPVDAVYGLPVLFKDSSPGLLYADELVFAWAGSSCHEELMGFPAR